MSAYPCTLADWEAAEHEKETRRVYKTRKRFVCPRAEKLRDYRSKKCHTLRIGKEDKWTRKHTVRMFRRKLARNMENEVYYSPRNTDYRTGGWLCW